MDLDLKHDLQRQVGLWELEIAAFDAIVTHPVRPARPTWHLAMARTVDHLRYLFTKHAASPEFRSAVRLFNRSHYLYVAVYVAAVVVGLRSPIRGAVALAAGLSWLAKAQVAYNWRGLYYSARELLLTVPCLPLVPALRLAYWVKGFVEFHLGLRRMERPATR